MKLSKILITAVLLYFVFACNKPEGMEEDVVVPGHAQWMDSGSKNEFRMKFYNSALHSVTMFEHQITALEQQAATAEGEKKGKLFREIGALRYQLSHCKSALYEYRNDVNAGFEQRKAIEASLKNIRYAYDVLSSLIKNDTAQPDEGINQT